MGCIVSKPSAVADDPSTHPCNCPWSGGHDGLEKTIRHLRNVFQDLHNSITDHADEINQLREHPQEALDQFAKDFTDAFGHEKEDEAYKPDLQPPQDFNNVTLFERMPKGYTTAQPKSLDELATVIQNATDARQTVKAVGTCYAFSDVSFTTGVIVEMNRYLHNILEIDFSVLKDGHSKTLLKVESGTMISSINEALWPSAKRDDPTGHYTLLNQTGYQGLSIAGAIGTGAHGSGLNIPILAEMVESVHLLTVDGDFKVKHYWIEPSNGVTDPEKFKAEYETKYGWELKQDDDVYHSTICHIGCFGIVYSYVIRTQPAFYLQEDRWLQTWDKTKQQLPELFKANMIPRGEEGSLHSFQIWINPYEVCDFKTKEMEVNSVVSTYKWAEPPRKNKRPPPFSASPKQNELMRQAVVFVARNTPKLMPDIMNIALMATTEKHPVTMPCTEALDFGSPNSTKVIVSELGIDASNVENVIKATDDLIQLFQEIQRNNIHQFAPSPFSLRFTAPAKTYLAPQYGRPSCMIETPILVGTPEAEDTLTKFRNLLREKYGGRPHWGQINDMDGAKLQELYPDDPYKKWEANFMEFNKTGTFNNQFTLSMGFGQQ